MIRLRILGPLDLCHSDGRELGGVLVQPKLVGLLAYLALSPSFQRRDKVVALFWPELDQAHARASLRTAIHRLRQALGEDVIVGRGTEEVGLNRARLWCDGAACRQALDAGDFAAAIDLYTGDLLDSFHVPDAASELDRWVDETRVRLRRDVTQAARRLATEGLEAGRIAEALTLLRRAQSIAPEDETVIRDLITLHDGTGDRAAALRTYEELAHRMEADYGATPAAETSALIDQVRARITPREPVPELNVRVSKASAPLVSIPLLLARRWRSRVAAIGTLLVMGLLVGWWTLQRELATGERSADALLSVAAWSPLFGDNAQALTHHSLVIDERRGIVYVYAGATGALIRSDAWRLTLTPTQITNWDRIETLGPEPAPRWGHAAVMDSVSGRMIVFGGALGHSSPCTNDVWLLKEPDARRGQPAWEELHATGTAPPARANASAVYDAASNQLIVFGGHDCFAPRFNDVWVLSHANGVGGTPEWRVVRPDTTHGVPTTRGNHTAVYDAGSHRMIVYGGTDADGVVASDCWILEHADGTTGTPRWLPASAGGGPGPRQSHTAIYDRATNRMIVFGGGNTHELSNDLWVLEGANGLERRARWTRIDVANGPPPRMTHAAAYDPRGERMIVIGGLTGVTMIAADMWVLKASFSEQRARMRQRTSRCSPRRTPSLHPPSAYRHAARRWRNRVRCWGPVY